jgi:hypothetical protein
MRAGYQATRGGECPDNSNLGHHLLFELPVRGCDLPLAPLLLRLLGSRWLHPVGIHLGESAPPLRACMVCGRWPVGTAMAASSLRGGPPLPNHHWQATPRGFHGSPGSRSASPMLAHPLCRACDQCCQQVGAWVGLTASLTNLWLFRCCCCWKMPPYVLTKYYCPPPQLPSQPLPFPTVSSPYPYSCQL